MAGNRRAWRLGALALGVVGLIAVSTGVTGRATGGCGGYVGGPVAGPAQLGDACDPELCQQPEFACDRDLDPPLCKIMYGQICTNSDDCYTGAACGFHAGTYVPPRTNNQVNSVLGAQVGSGDFVGCGGREGCTCLEPNDDISPPVIHSITGSPMPLAADQAIEVIARITDNGRVIEPTLTYGGRTEPMGPTGSPTYYSAWIPAERVRRTWQNPTIVLHVTVSAKDNAVPVQHSTMRSETFTIAANFPVAPNCPTTGLIRRTRQRGRNTRASAVTRSIARVP